MNRRSLLDYIDDKETGAALQPQPAPDRLEQRLADLERRLAVARAEAETVRQPPLASQIETILKRQTDRLQPQRAAGAEAAVAQRPYQQSATSSERSAPAFAAEADRRLEFAKFVEAVHLIGQAAKRFLHEPPALRPAGPSEDTLALTAALKDTIGAFQAMSADLAVAATQMRQAVPVQQPRIEPPASRPRSREDEELRRLERDLSDLRDRLVALSRRRGND